ncbi:MAG: hypothetical protein QNL46_00990 [Saprospiraceae bacterium]
MKRDILLLCIINMLGLLIFTNVDHILWLTEYSETGINWTEELFPLLINNIIWLSLIPLFLIWKTQKELSKSIFILLIATVLVQVATTVFAQITNDPLEAGLPFVIITIPLSIILLIFVVKELRSKT